VFLSKSTHALDPKGRVFVPKRFQEVLERDSEGHQITVLTRGFEGCLFLFSVEGFAEAVRRLHTQAFRGEKLRRIQRLFFSSSHRIQLDGSGRLLIPEELRRFAGLEREAVMVGSMDRAEIWALEAWESFEQANAAAFDELGGVLFDEGGPPSTGTSRAEDPANTPPSTGP